MQVPALDLQRQYRSIKSEVQHAIRAVCASQQFILGNVVAEFERAMAQYCGTQYAIGCASGTDAILLSLMVAGVQCGDEVIVPSFTFIASAEPIARLGAQPVFCDINERTYTIDPATVARKITAKTKTILVVHLYGQTADMQPMLDLAKKHNLAVIEDACQAIGAIYGPTQQKAGSMGNLGCFSFFPSKNLGGFGDGGMIVTNNKQYVDTLRMLREHGTTHKYYHARLGMNSRLDAIQAAVLQVKMKYLDTWIQRRNEKAAYYNTLFEKKLKGRVTIPYVAATNRHTYHQYIIKIQNYTRDERDSLVDHLRRNGVGASVYYPQPCHLQQCFSHLNYQWGSLPVTEQAADTIVALPIFAELRKKEQKHVVEAVCEFLLGNK